MSEDGRGTQAPPLFFKRPRRGQFLKGHDPWEGRGHQGAGWRRGREPREGWGQPAPASPPTRHSLRLPSAPPPAGACPRGRRRTTETCHRHWGGRRGGRASRRIPQIGESRPAHGRWGGTAGGEDHLSQRQHAPGTLRDRAPRSASLARGRSLPPRPSPSCPAEKVLPRAPHCSNGPQGGPPTLPPTQHRASPLS